MRISGHGSGGCINLHSPGLRRVNPKLLFGFTVSSDGIQMRKVSLAVDGIQKCGGFPRPVKSWLMMFPGTDGEFYLEVRKSVPD